MPATKNIDIGADIVADIKRMTSPSALKEVKNEVADIYHDSIERMNSKSQNPDGNVRTSLNFDYAEEKRAKGRQPEPDFVYSGRARASLEPTVTNKGVTFSYRDAQAAEYMYDNEFGIDVPERRQFPVEKDKGTEQQENIREVEQALTEHLNRSRTIRGGNG